MNCRGSARAHEFRTATPTTTDSAEGGAAGLRQHVADHVVGTADLECQQAAIDELVERTEPRPAFETKVEPGISILRGVAEVSQIFVGRSCVVHDAQPNARRARCRLGTGMGAGGSLTWLAVARARARARVGGGLGFGAGAFVIARKCILAGGA